MLACLRLGADARLLPVDPGQLGAERTGRAAPIQQGGEAPVLLRLEGVDLALAVDDQADRDALHPTGRQAAPDLAADQRAQLVADQAVDHPARLLRVDEVQVDGARMGKCGVDGRLGDLAEGDPADPVVVEPRVVGDMPGDRLALAVEVGGEPDQGRLVGLIGQAVKLLASLLQGLVARLEAAVDVDAEAALGQITDVAIGGENPISGPQVALDGAGLGGRLDDDEVPAGVLCAWHG